jgi:hypothetical protein
MAVAEHPSPLPHAPVRTLFPGVWFAPSTISMRWPPITFSRNMVVVRGERGLVLLNPVRLSEDAEATLVREGPITDAVRLGTYHGRDDAYYVDRFGAALWGVPGRYAYPEPALAREIVDGGALPIPGARALVFTQTTLPECVVHLPEHRLLITCDSVQHYENDDRLSLLARLVMYPMGFFKPCVIGPIWLKSVVPEGGSVRSDFERILALDFDCLVSAHGTPKLGGAKDALRAQVERLAA